MEKMKGYLDVDTTDEYLDKPVPRYAPNGKPASLETTDRLLAEAERGERELPELPPPVDH